MRETGSQKGLYRDRRSQHNRSRSKVRRAQRGLIDSHTDSDLGSGPLTDHPAPATRPAYENAHPRESELRSTGIGVCSGYPLAVAFFSAEPVPTSPENGSCGPPAPSANAQRELRSWQISPMQGGDRCCRAIGSASRADLTSCFIASATRRTSSESVGLRIGACGQRALKLAISSSAIATAGSPRPSVNATSPEVILIVVPSVWANNRGTKLVSALDKWLIKPKPPISLQKDESGARERGVSPLRHAHNRHLPLRKTPSPGWRAPIAVFGGQSPSQQTTTFPAEISPCRCAGLVS